MKYCIADSWRICLAVICGAALAACGGGGGGSNSPAAPAASPPSISLLSGDIRGQGNLDGAGEAARFNFPGPLALDPAGNAYVLDDAGQTIRRVTPGGAVSWVTGVETPQDGNFNRVLRDGDRSVASFSRARDIAFDPLRGVLYVADVDRIRQVTLDGIVTTLGPLPAASSPRPTAVAVAADGTVIMAAGKLPSDRISCCLSTAIYRDAQSGTPVLVAGDPTAAGSADGQGAAARFQRVGAVAIDRTGTIYVVDGTTLRKVALDGTVTTLAGPANGLAIDPDGSLLVADRQNQAIRKVTTQGVVSTLYDHVPFTSGERQGIGADASGRILYTAGYGVFAAQAGNPVRLVAGTLPPSPAGIFAQGFFPGGGFGPGGPLARDSQGNFFRAAPDGTIRKFAPDGTTVLPFGPDGGDLVISPPEGNRFRQVLAIDAADNLYESYWTTDGAGVSTAGLIIKISPSGQKTVLASSTASSPVPFMPVGITLDGTGNLYFIDKFGPAIRKLSPSDVLTAVANLASVSELTPNQPERFELVVDRNGNVYMSSPPRCVIYKVNAAGIPVPFAGQLDKCAQADGPGAQALLQDPRHPVLDSAGNLYVVNTNTIRKITPDGTVTTLAGVAGRSGNTLGLLPGTLGNVLSLWIGTDDVLYAIADNALLKITTR